MFDKLFKYFNGNLNIRTLRYTAGTIAVVYMISNFPPRPPNNKYLMRKY